MSKRYTEHEAIQAIVAALAFGTEVSLAAQSQNGTKKLKLGNGVTCRMSKDARELLSKAQAVRDDNNAFVTGVDVNGETVSEYTRYDFRNIGTEQPIGSF